MNIWHVTARDYNSEIGHYCEKKAFNSLEKAREYIRSHIKKYNSQLDNDTGAKYIDEYYQIVKIDTELTPKYAKLFRVHSRELKVDRAK